MPGIWISAQVTILYEHTEALIRLQDLLKLPTATDNRVRIVVKQLDFNNKEKNMCVIFWQKPSHSVLIVRRTLREVKQSGAGQVVVDCTYSNIRLVLKAAQAVRKILYHVTKIL